MMKKIIAFTITMALTLCMCNIGIIDERKYNVKAEEVANTSGHSYVSVTGLRNYEKAFKVLDIVNEKRALAGVEALTMDNELLEAAMVRSAELTQYFSHTRPDGTMCYSINYKISGENVAYGYVTSADVMDGWMNSQGHKENILRETFKSIGIGCFEYEGTCYWVQVFGTGVAVNAKNYENTTVTESIKVTSDLLGEDVTKEDPTDEEKTTQSETQKIKVPKTKIKKITRINKKSVKLSLKKVSGAKYQIRYSTNAKFKKAKNKISKNVTVTVKKLKKGKKYYFKVRAYKLNSNGKKVYSGWSKVKSIKMK